MDEWDGIPAFTAKGKVIICVGIILDVRFLSSGDSIDWAAKLLHLGDGTRSGREYQIERAAIDASLRQPT